MKEVNSIFPSWDILTYEKLDVKISFLRLKSYFRRAAVYEHNSFSYSRLYHISQHRVTLGMFEKLWKTLSVQEKKKLENHLIRFYLYLLQKASDDYDPRSTYRDLRTTFIELFNYLARNGYCGRSFDFLGMCSQSLGVKLQGILRMVPVSKLRFILFGFLLRRFFRTFNSTGELPIAILSHGCLYGYHSGYFYCIFKILLRAGFLQEQRGAYEEVTFRKNFIGNLRVQLTVEVLLSLFLEDEEQYIQLKFMEKLWKTIPCPYVTRTEMLQFQTPPDFEKKIISERCDLLEKHNLYLFPDVIQPRSLKHLSRCQILKFLHVNSRIGVEGIPSLDIPETLKKYLMLDEREF